MHKLHAKFLTLWLLCNFGALGTATFSRTDNEELSLNLTTSTSASTTALMDATTFAPNLTNNNINNDTTEILNPTNNFTIYDHKHKVILIVLSDLNVRKVNGNEQDITKLPTKSNTEDTRLLNKTIVLDEKNLNELLEKLQSTNKKDDLKTKCDETKKFKYVMPHYMPPTFPLLIRKDKRRPIAYMDSINCENGTQNDEYPDSSETENSKKKTNTKSRSKKRPQNRQRSRAVTYVLVPKYGLLNYFHNGHYAQTADGLAEPRAFYFSSEEYE
ncbi:uncharacterized protein [Eurosta solidaginis]|uniref:uncharacterized protein n=1 Tax=Eurosta solidaginis TaxID=178769 RepID=UPI003530F6BB